MASREFLGSVSPFKVKLHFCVLKAQVLQKSQKNFPNFSLFDFGQSPHPPIRALTYAAK